MVRVWWVSRFGGELSVANNQKAHAFFSLTVLIIFFTTSLDSDTNIHVHTHIGRFRNTLLGFTQNYKGYDTAIRIRTKILGVRPT